MQPVIQEDKTGCGLASVATVAGVSYQHVKIVASRLGIEAQDSKLWSETKYVRQLLAHYGFTPSKKTTPFTSWENLPKLALLAIKWHRNRTSANWHWVVFYRGAKGPMIFDSKRELRTNRRTDFWRITPKWFIMVHYNIIT